MNYVRLNEGLYQQSGGWEKFSLGESAPGSEIVFSLLEGSAPHGAPPEEDSPGRRAIVTKAVRQGKTLADTQTALSKAGAPQLYSRNLQDASVIFLLKLCPALKKALDLKGEEGKNFRLGLLTKLQDTARAWQAEAGRAALVPSQQAALDRLAASVKDDNCCFQDLADYVDAVFAHESDGSLLTQNVTGQVNHTMSQAVDAARKALATPETVNCQAAEDCVLSWWQAFLHNAGPDFARCQINALNYLVRALVRALEPVMDTLANLSWELRPQDDKDTFAKRMGRAYYRLGDFPCSGWRYYDLLSTLFVSSLDGDGLAGILCPTSREGNKDKSQAKNLRAASSKKEKPKVEIRSDLPLVLQPLFLFDRNLTADLYKRENVTQDALRMARATWASLKLSRTGLAKLLLLPLGELEEETLERTGSFLFRVLKGEADLPREAFLLLLMAAESVAVSNWPRRESVAERVNHPDSGSEDFLIRCGYGPLDAGCLFDAAVIAVLGSGCPADQRLPLLRKTATLCTEAVNALHDNECDTMLTMLARDAEDFEGQTGLEKAFEQLEKGRDATLFIYRS